MSRVVYYFSKYVCLVHGTGGTPVPEDMLLIRIKFARQCGHRLSTDPPSRATYRIEELLADREVMVPISDFKLISERPRWTKSMADTLSDMCVPRREHPGIIKDIFTAAADAVPGTSIAAAIGDTDLHIIGTNRTRRVEYSTTSAHMFNRNTSMTPVAKSCLEGLEKVRVDDDVIRETPSCVICHEDIDHFDNEAAKEEEGEGEEKDRDVEDLDHDHQPLMITRLPCSHQFHGHCIVRWLKIQHICPVCRYRMPTEETDGPKSKRHRVM